MTRRKPACWIDGAYMRAVRDLRPGDRADLQNDEFADPEGFRGVESKKETRK